MTNIYIVILNEKFDQTLQRFAIYSLSYINGYKICKKKKCLHSIDINIKTII